jgi:hypothetical protein
MSEQQPRKKLSIGRKTLTTSRATGISNNLKNKLAAKKDDNISNFLQNSGKELAGLYKERKIVDEQIKQMEHRLLFARSEPLQEYLFELKTKDFDLLTKINTLVRSK